MGDVADDMADEQQRWRSEGEWCKVHRCYYLPPSPCLGCEDGEPAVAELEDLEHSLGVKVVQCVDCGRITPKGQEVRHFPGCHPGTAAKWRELYDEFDDQGRLDL